MDFGLLKRGLPNSEEFWRGKADRFTSGVSRVLNYTDGADLVELNATEYDYGDVGDGLVTSESEMLGSPYDNRVTEMSYDWRDREIATKSGVQGSESTSVNRPISYQVLDNLGEATESDMYFGDACRSTMLLLFAALRSSAFASFKIAVSPPHRLDCKERR